MTVGPLARVEVSRGGSFTGSTGSAPKFGTLFPGPSINAPQIFNGNAASGGVLVPASSSPDSSRDTSPSRQPSGTFAFPEWKICRSTSLTNELAQVDVAAAGGPCIDPEAVLQEIPSLAYELGLKALWLDRHPSLASSRYSSPDDPQSDSQLLLKQSPTLMASRSGSSCLSCCPSWDICKSMIWAMAERYVLENAPPPLASSTDDLPADATNPTTEPASFPGAANTTGGSAIAPINMPSTGGQATPPLYLDAKCSCRQPPPLPSGIGPVGLSSPKQRFRRAALCIIARGRLQLKKGLREADQQEDLETATGAAAAAADVGSSATARFALASDSPAPLPGGATGSRRVRESGSLGIENVVADAVADAVATTPASRSVVRRRVRALVAGLSVAYTAANLGGCVAALMHADFAHDFASSAKAVLDFMFTAPSVTGIAQELMSIGVAVGLGMAQRRPPC